MTGPFHAPSQESIGIGCAIGGGLLAVGFVVGLVVGSFVVWLVMR